MEIRSPLEELKGTVMWQYLDDIDSNYARIVCSFVDIVSPVLSSIKDIFPFFTRHDAHHGLRVLQRMQQIVDNDCFKVDSKISFSSDETLLLICASYGHDLGMAIFPGEEKSLLEKLNISSDGNWKANPVLHSFLRKNHSQRGGLYISQNNDSLKLPANLIYLLHKLMEAHNLSINELDVQLGKRFAAGEKEIDLKQLACILCIADSIEFSETRVIEGVLDMLKEKMKVEDDPLILLSYQHNLQSLNIGNGVAIGSDGKIIFTGTFDDPDVLSLAHNTIDLIENWIRDYTDIDFQSKTKRLIIRSDSVIRELKIVGWDFERIGIRIKKENIIDLISSNSTWSSDQAIAIRELLQNSVEACRFRMFHSSSADNYHPQICITLDPDKKSISISDNGCGMSRNVILNNFLTVGNSRSFDPSYKDQNYSSLARFGIGFWSVFTIAEKAIIHTGPFEYYLTKNKEEEWVDGVNFEVSIKEFKDFTVFKPVKLSPGTTITLILKDSFSSDDMLFKLKYHIGCSEIPIKIQREQELIYEVPQKITLPGIQGVFGAKSELVRQQGVIEIGHKANVEDIDINIKIFYCLDEGRPSFLIPQTSQTILANQDRSISTFHRGTSICGFLFNYIPMNSIIDFSRIGVFSANALNPKGFIFTLNRLGILNSIEYRKFTNIVAQQIHECYVKLLDTTNSRNPQSIVRLNQQSRMNGGETHGMYTHSSLKRYLLEIPDLIAYKLYKIEREKSIETCEILYLYYKDLVLLDLDLWLYSTNIYTTTFRITPDRPGMLYEALKNYKLDSNSYFLECTREADMLADNAVNCQIVATTNVLNTLTTLPFRNFNSRNIDTTKSADWVIGEIRGTWSGTIIDRHIVGANFAFLSQHHVVLKNGSLLSHDIRELYNAKSNFKICQILNSLELVGQGFEDASIKKYL